MTPERLSVPTVREALDALPADLESTAKQSLAELLASLMRTPTPTGRLPRAWAFGTLPARLAAGFALSAVRQVFAPAGSRARIRQETNVRAALKVIGGMGYLRGAMTKAGQALTSYPDLVPAETYELLSTLHFEAPAMHYSLLREHVFRELGGDPEELFAEFDTEAFAAASLGQVHRARLKNGREVAVKIQYPNIARTIESDMANLRMIMAPMRLTRDWDNMVDRVDDIRATLERETDYEQEACYLERAHKIFGNWDDIVVPHVYPEFCSKRVLTMDFLPGVHLHEYLERGPSQEQRNHFGDLLVRVNYRAWVNRLLLADPNPGNYLFLDDGRLGLIDFGCCRTFTEDEWRFNLIGNACRPGDAAVRDRALKACMLFEEGERDGEARMALVQRSIDWVWTPVMQEEQPFDFGDAEFMREGIDLVKELTARRWTRAHPVFVWMNRMLYGVRGMLHALGAQVQYRRIDREEMAQIDLPPIEELLD